MKPLLFTDKITSIKIDKSYKIFLLSCGVEGFRGKCIILWFLKKTAFSFGYNAKILGFSMDQI